MTKEQIKAKAKEQFPNDEFKQQIVIDAINWATKELQKQIEIDAEHIIALQKQNGELTDKVNDLDEKLANADYQLEGRDNEIRELEAQIEKMKCWCNCKNYVSCLEECCRKNISFEKGICYNCKKWEINE